MKTIISMLLAVLLVSTIHAANVTFNLVDILGTVQNLQRKVVTIEPLSTVRANSPNVVLSEKRFFNTGTNASFTATNLNEGEYKVTVAGANQNSVFRINVPSTNGTIFAADHLVSISSTALDTEEGQTLDLE